MKHSALYTGSFDPITNGHLDVIRRACKAFDRLVIAVGVHPSKQPLLSIEERLELLEITCRPEADAHGIALDVTTFDDLSVAAALRLGTTIIVRGLRDGTDLDYEIQMAAMNEVIEPQIQTIFFPSSSSVRPISATLVRQIVSMGGDVSAFVPDAVAKKLTQKFGSG